MFILRTLENTMKESWWGRGLLHLSILMKSKNELLNDDYEEYAIHDYELPFEIDEYTSIEEINRLCGLAEELEGTPIGEVASEIQHAFNSFEEMVEHVDDIVYYPDCNDMEDLAYQMVNEGYLGDAPENFVRYFNYSSFARDLEIEGNYLVTNRGIFEYPI